ncbi:hypothetical protein EBZ38_15885, partial [bacterium]|nr:hypothetical protein [bacterium]
QQNNTHYGLTEAKFIDFLEHTLEQRRNSTRNRAEPGNLLNWLRKCVPVIERLAEWQGYTELASGMCSRSEIKTMKRELECEMDSQLDGNIDFAGVARQKRKRLTKDEQDAMLSKIFNNSVHYLDKITMRASIGFTLPSSDARRGMDLRQIKLGMFSTQVLDRIRPYKCVVVGASLFRSKGQRNKENQVGWIRSADRKRCPIGALAR